MYFNYLDVSGYFSHFRCFIFFFAHSSNFRGILIILVISEVFWSFLRFWNYFDVLGVFLLDLGYCW